MDDDFVHRNRNDSMSVASDIHINIKSGSSEIIPPSEFASYENVENDRPASTSSIILNMQSRSSPPLPPVTGSDRRSMRRESSSKSLTGSVDGDDGDLRLEDLQKKVLASTHKRLSHKKLTKRSSDPENDDESYTSNKHQTSRNSTSTIDVRNGSTSTSKLFQRSSSHASHTPPPTSTLDGDQYDKGDGRFSDDGTLSELSTKFYTPAAAANIAVTTNSAPTPSTIDITAPTATATKPPVSPYVKERKSRSDSSPMTAADGSIKSEFELQEKSSVYEQDMAPKGGRSDAEEAMDTSSGKKVLLRSLSPSQLMSNTLKVSPQVTTRKHRTNEQTIKSFISQKYTNEDSDSSDEKVESIAKSKGTKKEIPPPLIPFVYDGSSLMLGANGSNEVISNPNDDDDLPLPPPPAPSSRELAEEVSLTSKIVKKYNLKGIGNIDEESHNKMKDEMQDKVMARYERRESIKQQNRGFGDGTVADDDTSVSTENILGLIFPLSVLQTRTVEELKTNPYPTEVDLRCREQYLSDEEFMSTFGISKQVFATKPAWRQQEMKKRVDLY